MLPTLFRAPRLTGVQFNPLWGYKGIDLHTNRNSPEVSGRKHTAEIIDHEPYAQGSIE